MRKQIRQGDVLLVPIAKPRRKMTPREIEGKVVREFRVAGERSGHAHVLEDIEVLDVQVGKNTITVLHVEGDRILKHEEHAEVKVEPGFYQAIVQREHAEGGRSIGRFD